MATFNQNAFAQPSKRLSSGFKVSEIKLTIKPDETDADAAEILVDGMVGKKAYHFIFDTGAGMTNLVNDDYTRVSQRSEKNKVRAHFPRYPMKSSSFRA